MRNKIFSVVLGVVSVVILAVIIVLSLPGYTSRLFAMIAYSRSLVFTAVILALVMVALLLVIFYLSRSKTALQTVSWRALVRAAWI